MHRTLLPRVALVCALGLLGAGAATAGEPTLAARWNSVLLECIRRSRLGPPMVARAIGVANTCGYDAWSCFDPVGLRTRPGPDLRRPAAERTEPRRARAYSYAFYRALLDLFPAHEAYVREQMAALGFDPDDASADVASPAGLGNVCARDVLTFRHGDGANQLGDLHAGAYSDYTGYQPVNSPDTIVDPNRWQPLRFSDGAGGFVAPGFLAPHWGLVQPFALPGADAFRPAGPALHPAGAYVAQANEILRLNARLDDRDKVIAEYWADGPRTETPPGHWVLFAQWVSLRDGFGFDDDVRLFFTLGNAVQDAGIAAWESKRHFDSVRPITAIHFLKAGQAVLATVPGQGRRVIRGETWMPYQPATFVTPPFAEYVSGHSTFSAAAAEVLRRFTGSDAFGHAVTVAAGSSRVEPGRVPAGPVTLAWATFSAAADEAGFSRRLGGIHFADGDLDGRQLGRRVGAAVWDHARHFLLGDAGGGLAPAAGGAGATPALVLGPNPASGATRLEFSLARRGAIDVGVFDLAGRRVAELARGEFAPGAHAFVWSPARETPPGVYFVRVRSAEGDRVGRLLRVR